MHNIKLISIDLDGTLLKNDFSISDKCIQAIRFQKKKNIIIVFNTSRPLKLLPVNLYEEFYDDYWILSNGGFCVKSGVKIFENLIESNNVKNLSKSFTTLYENTFFSIESNNEIFSSFENLEKCSQYFAQQISKRDIGKKDITKFLIIDEGKEKICLDTLKTFLPINTKLLITDNNKYIQIMPKMSSKLLGILELINDLDLSLKNVLSFGDDLNDYELIKNSGIGVAMGNAHSEIKKVSKYITKSNEENGIYHFLNNKIKFQ